jgi:Rrf2 family transcriptional regulator, nitric oxide-sensitive transcriptional repressor
MRFTYYTDYALRVLMYLGARAGELCKTREIAASFAISEAHLVKVVHHLGGLGVVETVRGRGGGIMLAREPSDIGIGDVVRSTEAERAIVECFEPDTNRCPLSPACTLQRALAEALDAFYATLDEYTLADLLRPRASLRQLRALRVPGASPP